MWAIVSQFVWIGRIDSAKHGDVRSGTQVWRDLIERPVAFLRMIATDDENMQ